MEVVKKLSILSILIVILSCGEMEKKDVYGKYYNTFEEGVNHYVALNEDNLFVHYYHKKGEEEKYNKGKWTLRTEENGVVKVSFKAWESFGIYAKEYGCSNCLWTVKLKDGELGFNYDLPREMNFYKKD